MRRTVLLIAFALAMLVPSSLARADAASTALATPYTLHFAAGNIWDKPVPADAPIDPNSATMGPAFARSIGVTQDPTTGKWKVTGAPGYRWRSSYSIYTVHASGGDTPLLSVCSRFTNSGQGWSWMDSLANVLTTEKVPVPNGALTYDGGGDHSMAIYQPSRNYYAEFYQGLDDGHVQGTVDGSTDTFTGAQRFVFNNMPVRVYRYSGTTQVPLYGSGTAPLYTKAVTTAGMQFSSTPGGPTFDIPDSLTSVHVQVYDRQGRACNRLANGGGRMLNVTSNPGYFVDRASPVEDQFWGRQATGAMPVIAGMITPAEFDNPSPTNGWGHVLSVVVPWGKCGAPTWPAKRNDCGSAGVLPEGTWFRLPDNGQCARWDNQINATNPAPTPGRLLYLNRLKANCVNAVVYGFRVVDETGNGFAFKQPDQSVMPDDGPANHGGLRYPNDYIDPWADQFANLQVIAGGGQSLFGG